MIPFHTEKLKFYIVFVFNLSEVSIVWSSFFSCPNPLPVLKLDKEVGLLGNSVFWVDVKNSLAPLFSFVGFSLVRKSGREKSADWEDMGRGWKMEWKVFQFYCLYELEKFVVIKEMGIKLKKIESKKKKTNLRQNVCIVYGECYELLELI